MLCSVCSLPSPYATKIEQTKIEQLVDVVMKAGKLEGLFYTKRKRGEEKESLKKEALLEYDDDHDNDYSEEEEKMKVSTFRFVINGGCGSVLRCCQAEKCSADLRDAKPYNKKHKVCQVHAQAQIVIVDGICKRFCQQCSRFHELIEFDDTKRSCRSRLAGHNERRRKTSGDRA